jgi:CheY-specific phosphatase CheX
MKHTSAVQPTSQVMVTIVNSFLAAVIETFDEMLDCRATRGALRLREANATPCDVTALISLTGSARGAICLGFDRLTVLEIAARRLGGAVPGLSPAVIDAVGEVVHVIVEAAKPKLQQGLNMGQPTILRRERYGVQFPDRSEPMRLHFDSDVGPFFVDFGIVVTRL